jgi:hypothetical protein
MFEPAQTFPDETRFAADTLPVDQTLVALRFEATQTFPALVRFPPHMLPVAYKLAPFKFEEAVMLPVAITLVVETAFAA